MRLYYNEQCPFCRSTRLAIRAMGLGMEEIHLDLLKGEHLTPEFSKINPLHTVPTLIDGEHTLVDSRPLMMYLADKYAKDDSIYPKDPLKRHLVHQQLFFDAGTLSSRYIQCYIPVIKQGAAIDPVKKQLLLDALKTVDGMLSKTKWIAGDDMTIADHSFVVFISTMEAVKVDLNPYANIVRWLNMCKKEMPSYQEINQYGIDQFKEKMVKNIPALKD